MGAIKIPKGKTIDEWMAALPEPQRGIVRELRRIIRKAVPEAREIVKYDWPWYEMEKPIAIITVAGGHVHLELYRGRALKPASVPLEGTGKTMRYLEFVEVKQVKTFPVAALLREAADLVAAGQ
jgi:hypothetical protein